MRFRKYSNIALVIFVTTSVLGAAGLLTTTMSSVWSDTYGEIPSRIQVVVTQTKRLLCSTLGVDPGDVDVENVVEVLDGDKTTYLVKLSYSGWFFEYTVKDIAVLTTVKPPGVRPMMSYRIQSGDRNVCRQAIIFDDRLLYSGDCDGDNFLVKRIQDGDWYTIRSVVESYRGGDYYSYQPYGDWAVTHRLTFSGFGSDSMEDDMDKVIGILAGLVM